jgi:DNA-directed RNA polymerase specialized sigma24 family protein
VKRTSRDQSLRAHHLLDARPAPGPEFTLLIEARDFWRVRKWLLTDKQRSTIEAWICGATCREIAGREGVTESAVHERLSTGLTKLREVEGLRPGGGGGGGRK